MALRRRTTLKALVEHALRREIQDRPETMPQDASRYQRNELGFLMLKRPPSTRIRLEDIQKLEEGMDEAEFHEAIDLSGRT